MGPGNRPPFAMLRTLSNIPIAVAAIALFALMAMTFFDVVLRSTISAPIPAATELTRIFVAIAVFSVMPILSVTGGHISVDLTDRAFDRLGLARGRDAVIHVICGIALFWPVQRVWELAERSRSYGDVTEYLSIPQFAVGWFIAILTGLSAVALVVTGVLHAIAPHRLAPHQESRPE